MNALYAGKRSHEKYLVLAVPLEMLANGDSLRFISSVFPLKRGNEREWDREIDATFLINMYRSSGISGARPVM